MSDNTTQVFNSFYTQPLRVSADEYDVVLSFFKGLTTSEATAKTYAENLFYISNQTDIDVLTLLETFQADDKMKITLTMAYYLNSFSDKTVMYGVNQVIQPNQGVLRNVVQ